MNETPSVDDLGEAAPEYDDLDAGLPKPKPWLPWVIGAGVLGAIALVTWAIGIGPFGYRIFAYGNATIYVYNGTPHFAHVEIDGATFEIKPYEGETLEIVGGDLELETTLQKVEKNPDTGIPEITENFETLESYSFTATSDSPWLYHVATEESTCIAVADMKQFYLDGGTSEPEILAKVFKPDRLMKLPYENVLYPQDALPDKTSGDIVWLAVMNCGVLENDVLALAKVKAEAVAARRSLEERRERGRRDRGLE